MLNRFFCAPLPALLLAAAPATLAQVTDSVSIGATAPDGSAAPDSGREFS